MVSDFQEFVRLLGAVPRAAGGWEAQCPGHRDASPGSLILVERGGYRPAFILCTEHGCGPLRVIYAAQEARQ
jgi:hypothetical protein